MFQEHFEDSLFAERGWYDGIGPVISRAEHLPGSSGSAEYHFQKGGTQARSGSVMRRLFPESDAVYLSCYVKYSKGWEGSNKPYHPHEFHFVTNMDSRYVGPAYTHLTLYVEQNEGTPLLGIQDGENIDEKNIGVDRTDITEQRSVAGCNGDADGYGNGDCYMSGTLHFNGKVWRAPTQYFTDLAGSHYKGDWHHVEAYFRLNSIRDGKGIPDGVVRYWFDDSVIIDHGNVMLRTGQYPAMKFNQFLIAPYIGDGSPVDQTLWVDDLTVATGRITDGRADVPPGSSKDGMTDDSAAASIAIMPNPSAERATIVLRMPAEEPGTLKIFASDGAEVSTVIDGGCRSGNRLIDLREFPAGIYFLRLCTASHLLSRSFVVVK
ncbi:MAG: hypothetical protein ABIR47_13965 [Candidatus Kapaibacterium sp.]